MKKILFFMILSILPACAEAAPVLLEASSIGFLSRQMGVPVTGSFKRFEGDVRFDPKDAKKSGASLTVHIDSIDAGSDEATFEIKRRTWFDAAGYPTARFVSTSVVPEGPGRYRVSGNLTIKGRTRAIEAPFSIKKERGGWLIEGSYTLNRLDFSIGEGAWADTATVAKEVEVSFRFSVPDAK